MKKAEASLLPPDSVCPAKQNFAIDRRELLPKQEPLCPSGKCYDYEVSREVLRHNVALDDCKALGVVRKLDGKLFSLEDRLDDKLADMDLVLGNMLALVQHKQVLEQGSKLELQPVQHKLARQRQLVQELGSKSVLVVRKQEPEQGNTLVLELEHSKVLVQELSSMLVLELGNT